MFKFERKTTAISIVIKQRKTNSSASKVDTIIEKASKALNVQFVIF